MELVEVFDIAAICVSPVSQLRLSRPSAGCHVVFGRLQLFWAMHSNCYYQL
jgi:hypothetical protein